MPSPPNAPNKTCLNNNVKSQSISPSTFGKVIVLMGGWSAEREISLMSGNEVLASLKRLGIDAHGMDAQQGKILTQLEEAKPDRVFITLHGRDGESGFIQAILEGLHIPHTGANQTTCAFTLDKLRNKWLWMGAGLPVAKMLVLTENSNWSDVVETLGLPLFVKPSLEGSSIGITKVKSIEQLPDAYKAAAEYEGAVMAEAFIDGPEYSIPMLANRELPSICIRPANEFYDYEAKYFVETTQYDCPSGLSAKDEKQIQTLARLACDTVGCKGWGRVDVMRCRHTGQFYLVEINTSPGMTSHSLPPKAARAVGMSFDELNWEILKETL